MSNPYAEPLNWGFYNTSPYAAWENLYRLGQKEPAVHVDGDAGDVARVF